MFDFSELTPEQLEERKASVLTEMEAPEMGADELEGRKAEILAIDAELEARKQAAIEAEEARKAVENGAGQTKEEFKQEEREWKFLKSGIRPSTSTRMPTTSRPAATRNAVTCC